MQLIRVGDKVRIKGQPETIHTVIGLQQAAPVGGRGPLDTVTVQDLPYPVKAEVIERVYLTAVGDTFVLRNGRGEFEVGDRTFDELTDAVGFIKARTSHPTSRKAV